MFFGNLDLKLPPALPPMPLLWWVHSDHWSQSTDYLRSPRTITTHGLVAFQVSDVWFHLQLFHTGVAPCLSRLLLLLLLLLSTRFPLHVFCPQLLCQLLQDFPPGSPAAGAPWIKCGHLSQPGQGCYRRPPPDIFRPAFDRVHPCHLVRDVLTVLSVVVHHRLWFCLRPTKGAHTCVHGAQDADILPRLSLLHIQNHITSAPNSFARCFTEEKSCFCLPMVPTRWYNTTMW